MASTYKTPGVYIQEISKFPPSIAAVDTAIPAFIGYTEKAVKKGENLHLKPTRITSMVEFESYFGFAPTEEFIFDINLDTIEDTFEITPVKEAALKYKLFYAMQMFFANGGGPCFIVSVGDLTGGMVNYPDLKKGIDVTEKIDEVTLFVIPDSVELSDGQHVALMNHALAQCQKLQDRFTIIDVKGAKGPDFDENLIKTFRGGISGNLNEIKYGGAYYPYLETILTPNYDEDSVRVRCYSENGAILSQNVEELKTLSDALKTAEDNFVEAKAAADFYIALDDAIKDETDTAKLKSTIEEKFDPESIPVGISDAINAAAPDEQTIKTAVGTEKSAAEAEQTNATTALATAESNFNNDEAPFLDGSESPDVERDLSYKTIGDFKNDNNALFNAIKMKIQEDSPVILPPSGAIAGIYAKVDNSRGVWKAPANVSVNGVRKPSVKANNDIQNGLNVDAVAGKSINVIRTFIGKGTLVWGARTLAGNDNEWRYISVRRFFNFAEESIKKGTEQFVFEPNDRNTWTKVRGMIENFLLLQWRAGALAGATPEDAYFVKVGLPETMTALDVLEGRMIVEIGMAVVRPAEFIILKFSHKMQES